MAMIKTFLKNLFTKQGKAEQARTLEAPQDYACYSDSDMPFPTLNPLQSFFRDKYDPDRHTVIESGVGTGKTALAYIASRSFLDRGQRVILTAPLRELVKQLYTDSKNIWGAGIVGMNTGQDNDVKDKFFIVTTPEGYNSAVRKGKEWVKAGLMIVDEAHNIFESKRGKEVDAAVAIHTSINNGKVLLMSGTFPYKEEVADWLKADLFTSKYKKTMLDLHEVHSPDDIEAAVAPIGASGTATMSGHIYNRNSKRIRALKEILQKHEGESILIFVQTKAVGFCLGESLVSPFHCADIEEKEKKRIVAEFNAGHIKTLLATSTLSQGVNTPADVVIVCGTKSGAHFQDLHKVVQMTGRAGRGKDKATAYVMGDKIELYNARRSNPSSATLPSDSLVMTGLSMNSASAKELAGLLSRTYAAAALARQEKGAAGEKIRAAIEKTLSLLRACKLLNEKAGKYSLTMEGILLARYCINPKTYMAVIGAARKLKTDLADNLTKGCILLAAILPGFSECPAAYEKDILMRLIPLELDKDISAARAGYFLRYAKEPLAMPRQFLDLRDSERLVGALTDCEKYRVHKEAPGKVWLQSAIAALKLAAAGNLAVQNNLKR